MGRAPRESSPQWPGKGLAPEGSRGKDEAMRAALIARQFDVPGRLVTVEPYGSGNVNDTYLAIFRTTFDEKRFVLQRIRKAVFPEPEAIMHNMRVITDHCHAKLEAEAEGADRIWQLPKIIPTREGGDWAIDADGDLWRAISQIAGAQAHERVLGPEHAREVGIVLGHFHRMVSDIEPGRLKVALPGFHITPGYLARLDAAAASPKGRERLAESPEAALALRFAEARRAACPVLEDAVAAGRIARRVMHGDPKVGNVMIDEATAKGTCIVDLDTVQAGLVHYDIGDALRSACNPAGEDAPELGAVAFDTDLCEAIWRGYLGQAREFLGSGDRELLYECTHLIPLELGIRFLADHLAGDTYFKVRYPGHNLRRARVQFRLVESIEARESAIRRIFDRR